MAGPGLVWTLPPLGLQRAWSSSGWGRGLWKRCSRGAWGRGQRPGTRGSGLAVPRTRGRGSGLGPAQRLADSREAGSAGASSQWTRGPRAVTKGRSQAAAAAGEVGRGGLAQARQWPGRATGGGGGTMEAAVAAPRPWLFLLVLAAAAAMTLVPGATGERRGWRG